MVWILVHTLGLSKKVLWPFSTKRIQLLPAPFEKFQSPSYLFMPNFWNCMTLQSRYVSKDTDNRYVTYFFNGSCYIKVLAVKKERNLVDKLNSIKQISKYDITSSTFTSVHPYGIGVLPHFQFFNTGCPICFGPPTKNVTNHPFIQFLSYD